MLPDVLSYESGSRVVTWRGVVDALREGHRLGRPALKDILLEPGAATLLNRAAFVRGLGFAVKAETIVPTNASRGLPSIQGYVVLFDDATGSVRAVIESRLVTDYKTAADSVLGALLLARPGSRHLVICGAGVVAANLAAAYADVFPALERISIWARRPDQARSLANAGDIANVTVGAVNDLEAAVREADIVSTATMAREPILKGAWLRPGTHVDLVGGFTPDMREADDELMASSRVFVDCLETTVDRVGDLTQPIASGAIVRAHVLGDLYDLLAREVPSRNDEHDVTVFKNGGGAHLDLMVANHIAAVMSSRPRDEPP